MSSANEETQVWTPDFVKAGEPLVGGKPIYADAPTYRPSPAPHDNLPERLEQGWPIEAISPSGELIPGVRYVDANGRHCAQFARELPQGSTFNGSGSATPELALNVHVGNAKLSYESTSGGDVHPGEAAFMQNSLAGLGKYFAHLTGNDAEQIGTFTPDVDSRQMAGTQRREFAASRDGSVEDLAATTPTAVSKAASQAGELAKDKAKKLAGRAAEVDIQKALRKIAPYVGAWMLTGALFTTFNTFTPGGAASSIGIGSEVPVLTGSPKDLITFAEGPYIGGKAVVNDVEGILGIVGRIL
jgi:hypothetical protein